MSWLRVVDAGDRGFGWGSLTEHVFCDSSRLVCPEPRIAEIEVISGQSVPY